MENAAKGLTIAGGVLVAIIVISTLWYSFHQWGLLPQAKAENEKASQDIAFNQEFESYNKQNIYGAEIITILNKAIENNEKYGITADTTDPYYIDVVITISTDVKGFTKKYVRDKHGVLKDESTIYSDAPILKANTSYRLSNFSDFTKLNNLTKVGPIDVNETKRGNEFIYTEEYSAEKEFRLRYFKCTGIEYDEFSGRINCIKFEEWKTSDHRYELN